MKIFIGGSRGIKNLDRTVYCSLEAMYKSLIYKIDKNKESTEVLIGDADGVDLLVQEFYHKLKRRSVTVFACEGKARNNVGGWKVENVAVTSTVKDFSYYSQKDIAMAKAADRGFMIWNGKSKGTLCNIINLVLLNKKVSVYFTPAKEYISIKNIGELKALIESCCENTQSMYVKLQCDYIRKLYIEAIKKYMESNTMRDYLVENVDKLKKHQIIDLICGARADLKDKYETLKEIAALETNEEAEDRYSATNAAKNAKEALEELSLKDGELFLNVEYGHDYKTHDRARFNAKPHFSLKPIIDYAIKEYSELNDEKKENATYWYEIEKYVPGVIDDFDMPCNYIMAPDGEIWFTDNVNFLHLDFSSSQYLNLPVPFKKGDIITIDCRPFVPVKHGVIIETGDNWDCCAIQCAYVGSDGKIKQGALKHADFFDNGLIEVSPLYRAKIFNGELPENEKCLIELSEKLKRQQI